jgi:hypothetical protein
MEEPRMVDSELNQSQPNTSESLPTSPTGGTSGSGSGDNKPDPISASPTIGGGVAGRDSEGNSTLSDGGE